MNAHQPLPEIIWRLFVVLCLLIAGEVASGGDRREGFGE